MMNIKNFFQRLLTAMILIPIVIYILNLGGIYYETFILVIMVIMAFEWYHITHIKGQPNNIWNIMGIILITIPSIALIWLRKYPQGEHIILWLLLIIWGSDIGGYIVGKSLKGPKLAPKISPNKTWSGFIGGLILAGLISGIYAQKYLILNNKIVVISIIISVISQLSDLMESSVKRKFGVKDSGNIIPGHGGILDRVDGLILAAPIATLIISLLNIFQL